MSESRYAVGIDLGTTHCALAAVELPATGEAPARDAEVVGRILAVPQVVAPGNVEPRHLLPSFLYLPHPDELPEGALTLPWLTAAGAPAVGEVARQLGAKSVQRLVASAKSWLCHPGVDRRAPILPAGAPDEVPKISPLEASVRYLEHLKAAFDHAHPGEPLEAQRLTLTVPASFDPAARELTAEAARQAGLGHAVLLEEPQAALYSWIMTSEGGFREQVSVGDVILVIDVGGGTTDLSLIAVREEEGNVALERIAVGEHILLGGDNMDLALAYHLKGQLERDGRTLDAMQMLALTHAARVAKERLLTHTEEAEAPVVIPGRGSKLVGGTLRATLAREDLATVLLDGFFPVVDAAARPATRARAGLTQLGLPYAQDAGITRHLAAFLGKQAGALGAADGAAFARPSAILFNGGVFKSALLEDRVLSVVNGWLEASGAPPARKLSGADLDLAVARGAAYYGYVREGHGIRIRGGTAMAYYVGVESAMPAVPGMPPPMSALCVAPFGLEEGTRAAMPDTELGLVVGEPVRFRFFGSSVRREDVPGVLLDRVDGEELGSLQDIEVTLPAEGKQEGEIVVVRLQAGITEVGTLELEAVEKQGPRRWKVELDTRESAA